MMQRDNRSALVDVIQYNYFRPDRKSEDAVYKFAHSDEVNDICANMLIPYVVTPVDRDDLRLALTEYIQRRSISSEDESSIRDWLDGMPENIAIIERHP